MRQCKLLFLLLFTLCSLLTTAYAQWLETTIYVPDSLSGMNWPQVFTCNATNNKIYVGGEEGNCVIVIDGATNQKIARIPAGSNIYALCWNAQNNKIYCANYSNANVTVIDGQTNSVATTITVGSCPKALVWNSTNNKVYCANYWDDNVTIIDGTTNILITTVPVGNEPCALVWNSTNNKVYCANSVSDNVTVIDGVTNSVITTILLGDCPSAFCWNSIQNRVYVANHNSSSVSVIQDAMPGMEERSTLNAISTTLEFYPNPAKAFFTIRIPQSTDCSQIKIFDVTGKVVKEAIVNEHETRISLDGIKSGVYFVQVENEIVKEKLIVTR